jgi:hypothetical protein
MKLKSSQKELPEAVVTQHFLMIESIAVHVEGYNFFVKGMFLEYIPIFRH